jgi:hypothetical protein
MDDVPPDQSGRAGLQVKSSLDRLGLSFAVSGLNPSSPESHKSGWINGEPKGTFPVLTAREILPFYFCKTRLFPNLSCRN